MDKKAIKETYFQAEKLANILGQYADLIDRFPLELSPMMLELKNKGVDVYYLEKLLRAYTSIVQEHGKIAKNLTLLVKESKKTQLKLNPDKFNYKN
ncbi:MAG: hypothetical protein KDC90_00880 [Ignavibacteriae bacterium]|nr:hypothetical protein [Ignavibacteriota bacterium]